MGNLYLLGIALAVVGAVGVDGDNSPDVWDVGKWRVHFWPTRMNYHEAKNLCKQESGRSMVGKDAIDSIITWTAGETDISEYWIALQQQIHHGGRSHKGYRKEGVWKWDDGSMVGSMDQWDDLQGNENWKWWRQGEPNNKKPCESSKWGCGYQVGCHYEDNAAVCWGGKEVCDISCIEKRPVLCVTELDYEYFLAEDGQGCDQACEEKGSTCNNKMLEDAAADYDSCKSIIAGLKVVQVNGHGGIMSIIDNDGLQGSGPGCTWHPGSDEKGYVQLLTKNDDKPKCDGDTRDGTARRRVCACSP